jgi:DNA-binding NarL/FixJ family response regulator
VPEETPLSEPIRVLVVEDDRTAREGLRIILEATAGYGCAGAFMSVEDALRARPAASPDVILLDVGLPGMDGAEGVVPLRQKFPGALVLMLTVFEDEERVFASICNGACGYLLKKTPPARLLEAVREAYGGGAPLSPEIARKVVALFQRTGPPLRLECRLSDQEVRLLELLSRGHSYQAAADQLGISINTVRKHVRAVYEKLHVHSKSEAVSRALKAGLL